MFYFYEVGNKGDQWNKVEFILFNVDSIVVLKVRFQFLNFVINIYLDDLLFLFVVVCVKFWFCVIYFYGSIFNFVGIIMLILLKIVKFKF